MSVASQLRLAIGVLILLLAGILAVALYVPAQIYDSANEKYVEDAIPLGNHVHELTEGVLEQQAALQAFLLTRDARQQERYSLAQDDVLRALGQIRRFEGRHPELVPLTKKATTQISDLTGSSNSSSSRAIPRARRGLGSQLERELVALQNTSNEMLQAANRTVNEAQTEQRIASASSSSSSRSLGGAGSRHRHRALPAHPRRLGDLYEAELASRQEAESRAEAARALEHVSDGVILTDDTGRVRFWNPGRRSSPGSTSTARSGASSAWLLPGGSACRSSPTPGSSGAPRSSRSSSGTSAGSRSRASTSASRVYAVRDVTEERALETMRSDFVTTASHELRTPMTSISGAATDAPPPRRRAAGRPAGRLPEDDRQRVRPARGIVDQILLASRIEAGRIEVLHERCDAGRSRGRSSSR